MTANPIDFPLFPDRSIPVPVPPPPAVGERFEDQGGDVWRVTEVRADGEALVACDEPIDVEDRGEGPSHAWTLRKVERRFGPLVRPLGGVL
ncbi:hypothetical protein [Streptomyces sp. MI02-7b]|uniref:hypothetical protein n=1 Tax=Streptomyces sp. MI02-7b TaxID=462941 RepID=UPI0029B9C2F8|nr:hypothetical protein [Streptomyces sp. MI02-7b]MDX3074580.1 hypothetical protein [Streptomyces sp. MI02-7b]